jgi:hypothetical protein
VVEEGHTHVQSVGLDVVGRNDGTPVGLTVGITVVEPDVGRLVGLLVVGLAVGILVGLFVVGFSVG